MRFAVILSLALAACGDGYFAYDPHSDNHGFGWHFDRQGPRGLKLRYGNRIPADNSLADPATYEAWFDEVQQCTGLTAPMVPFVIWTDTGNELAPHLGLYYLESPPLIRIAIADAFKPEALHYLLQMATGDADVNHVSPFVAQCAPAPH